MQCNVRGALSMVIQDPGSNLFASVGTPIGDNIALQTAQHLRVLTSPYVFSGTNWDRQFACTQQAQATVTLGTTAQVIAASGSTNIRICSMSIGISITGTYAIVSGTGANCGTGTATIVPATPLATGQVVSMGDGTAAVIRGGASNAVCVTAGTGNVSVYFSFAQY